MQQYCHKNMHETVVIAMKDLENLLFFEKNNNFADVYNSKKSGIPIYR